MIQQVSSALVLAHAAAARRRRCRRYLHTCGVRVSFIARRRAQPAASTSGVEVARFPVVLFPRLACMRSCMHAWRRRRHKNHQSSASVRRSFPQSSAPHHPPHPAASIRHDSVIPASISLHHFPHPYTYTHHSRQFHHAPPPSITVSISLHPSHMKSSFLPSVPARRRP